MKWIQRHLKDEFVKKANNLGYCSRSAFKLLEIQNKYKILKPHHQVLDCGAAPGGWTQVLKQCRKCVSVDLLPLQIQHYDYIQGDFNSFETKEKIKEYGKFDVVLSDLAPNFSGNQSIDRIRTLELAEQVLNLDVLEKNGNFCCKVFWGPEAMNFNSTLKKCFNQVFTFKPKSSRDSSAEVYFVGLNNKKNK